MVTSLQKVTLRGNGSPRARQDHQVTRACFERHEFTRATIAAIGSGTIALRGFAQKVRVLGQEPSFAGLAQPGRQEWAGFKVADGLPAIVPESEVRLCDPLA